MRVTTALIIFLLLIVAPRGAVYYVDYIGGADANNGTTTGTPFKRIPGDGSATGTAASTTPAAGDTIAVKGPYTVASDITIKSSGSSGNYIIYDGNYPGWGPGTRCVMSGSGDVLMNLKDYIIWQNFEHDGGPSIFGDGHATLSQDNWLIRTNYFHDFAGQAVTFFGDVNQSTISDCTFEYCNYLRGGDGAHDGASGSTTVLSDSTKNFTVNALVGFILYNKSRQADAIISANTATTITTATMETEGGTPTSWQTGNSYAIRQSSSSRGAIYMNGDRDSPGGIAVGDTIGNKVLRCTTQYNGDTPWFFFSQEDIEVAYCTVLGPNAAYHSNGMTHYNSQDEQGNAEIHHNYFSHERVCITFENTYGSDSGINIYNNILDSQNNVSHPLTSNGPHSGGTGGTVRILNNVLIGGSSGSIGFGSDNWDSIIIKNNILKGAYSEGSGTDTASHNCYTHTTTPNGETGSLFITNLSTIFEDTALDSADDFQILSTFLGRDAGADLSASGVTDDYDGTSRPQGAAFDIGAFEYDSGGISGVGDINITELRVGTIQVAP